MSNLQELIARVEACGVAGNFQLECDIAIALGVSKVEKHGAMNLQTTPPPYTRSLDAAVRLVEEKRQQKGEWSVDGFGNAAVFGKYPQARARAATPALALCLALLRALAGDAG